MDNAISLAEKYAKILGSLSGNAFQKEVCARLRSTTPSFQNIPAKDGDGGLDAISHNGECGYCCYGPEYDSTKSANNYADMIVEKFKSDMRRVFEVESAPKEPRQPKTKNATGLDSQKATKFVHKQNKELEETLPPNKSIKHLRLLVNRFETKKIIKRLHKAFDEYRDASKCRFVEKDLTLVIDGPKELAEEHFVDELMVARAAQRNLAEKLEGDADNCELDGTTFESKMAILRKLYPDKHGVVDGMAESFRRDWRLALACERDLDDSVSSMHRALENGREILLTEVYSLMLTSSMPWAELAKARELAQKILRPCLEAWYGDMFPRVCNGEIAMLIGECPIGWKGE